MSLKIRLSRGGAKKRPYYRIVAADSRYPRDGRYLEQIGTYNPMLPKDSGERVKLNEDRARHWLSVGENLANLVHQGSQRRLSIVLTRRVTGCRRLRRRVRVIARCGLDEVIAQQIEGLAAQHAVGGLASSVAVA